METEQKGGTTGGRLWIVLLAVLLVLLLSGTGYIGYQVLNRLDEIETQISELSTDAIEATDASQRALERAGRAEDAARAAAEGRLLAEAETARASEDAALAREDADSSREERDRARAEAERIRKEAEAELNRLEEALGQIADTRRTALGLVMNLDESALKFDFDKSDLKPPSRELLSRVAGILLTSHDFTVEVNGHTDDVGTTEYNQKLSERRAQAVHDYLVEAGIDPAILSVKGWGEAQPLVKETTDAARAKNRRVELGIMNTRISYPTTQRH